MTDVSETPRPEGQAMSQEGAAERLAKELLLSWMGSRPAGVYQSSIQVTEFKRLTDIIAQLICDVRNAALASAQQDIEDLKHDNSRLLQIASDEAQTARERDAELVAANDEARRWRETHVETARELDAARAEIASLEAENDYFRTQYQDEVGLLEWSDQFGFMRERAEKAEAELARLRSAAPSGDSPSIEKIVEALKTGAGLSSGMLGYHSNSFQEFEWRLMARQARSLLAAPSGDYLRACEEEITEPGGPAAYGHTPAADPLSAVGSERSVIRAPATTPTCPVLDNCLSLRGTDPAFCECSGYAPETAIETAMEMSRRVFSAWIDNRKRIIDEAAPPEGKWEDINVIKDPPTGFKVGGLTDTDRAEARGEETFIQPKRGRASADDIKLAEIAFIYGEEEHYSDVRNYAAEIPAMEAYAREADEEHARLEAAPPSAADVARDLLERLGFRGKIHSDSLRIAASVIEQDRKRYADAARQAGERTGREQSDKLMRANLATMQEARNRFERYGKSHHELNTAISETKKYLRRLSPDTEK